MISSPIRRARRTALAQATLIVLSALVCGAATTLAAAADPADAPTLVVALHVRPQDRPRLRAVLRGRQEAALSHWQVDGRLSGYELLYSRYADRRSWDALEVLHFPSDAALAFWRRVERVRPGGLVSPALALVRSMSTTVADAVRAGGPADAKDPAILAIPYHLEVPPGRYLRYLDGYTLPQMRGWVAAGVLDSYEILLCRYPAGRRWGALLLLRYRDDAALARRAAVLAAVRTELGKQPAWKTYSDSKQDVRKELAVMVADRIAAEGAR
ncbi:MAG: hypothetical protein KGL34_12065 [Gammaproteobacteria bacterium]|nr:hypothetical protein [Gammaproteobacteria bacterium]